MSEGWLVTGVSASGKTTVAALLAERLGLPFVEGDKIRPPGDGPSEERYLRLAAVAQGAVVEDVILGEWLVWFIERAAPSYVVVLAPSADAIASRNEGRDKDGYSSYTLDELDKALREETHKLGLWIDNSSQTPVQTVDAILARAGEALINRGQTLNGV